jgi:hypothetical protein
MSEYERLYVRVPSPQEEQERYVQWLKENVQQQEEEDLDDERGVIIIDI